MRRVFLTILGLAVGALQATAQDDGQKAAKALVDNAVKAVGGADRLGKVQAVSAKGKATLEGGRKLVIDFNGTYQSFDRFRLDMDTFQNNPLVVTMVFNGAKDWIKGAADQKFNVKLKPVQELLFDAGMKQDLYAIQLAQSLLPLTGKGFELSAAGEVKIGDRPAIGFRVVREGRPDVNIYLDKETSLPVKCEMRVRSDKANQEYTHEVLLRDYKEIDGVKHFTKIIINRDEQKIFEADLSEIQFLDKVGAKVFAEP